MRSPARAAALAFVMPTLALADSALLTTLLTQGLGAATLICLLMPREDWQPEPKPPEPEPSEPSRPRPVSSRIRRQIREYQRT